MSESSKTRLSESSKGEIWINNKEVSKCVDKEDLESYLNSGWIKGRIKKTCPICYKKIGCNNYYRHLKKCKSNAL